MTKVFFLVIFSFVMVQAAPALSEADAKKEIKSLALNDKLVKNILASSAEEILLTAKECALEIISLEGSFDSFNKNKTVSGEIIINQNCAIVDDAGGNNTKIEVSVINSRVFIDSLKIDRSSYL